MGRRTVERSGGLRSRRRHPGDSGDVHATSRAAGDVWWSGRLFALAVALLLTPTSASAQRTTVETAQRFHCAGSICFLTAARCERYVQDARDLGERAGACRERPVMACFDYLDVYDDAEYTRCYSSPRTCQHHLRRFRRGNYYSRSHGSPRYAGVSECQTFRYSRRRAREIAERERQEAELERQVAAREAELAAEREEYERVAERRASELLALVLRGATLSRPVYCGAPDTEDEYRCRFEPVPGYLPVEAPSCLAGVNPDGRLAFACFRTRAFCVSVRNSYVERERDSPLGPLRVTGDCFEAREGRGGPSFFVIDEEGDEVVEDLRSDGGESAPPPVPGEPPADPPI